MMNHKEILENCFTNKNSSKKPITTNAIKWAECIANNANKQKGVYTVLITLLVHKIFDPKQDIRKHQSGMENGFSGRSIDTKYITPTLKSLDLPAMSESGWLTRSLEQPYPYNLDYNGKIAGSNNNEIKKSFLGLLDAIENNRELPDSILRTLLNSVFILEQKNKIKITKIDNADTLSITQIIAFLEEQFSNNYKTHGGSKLPVIAIYSMMEILVKELNRYKNCELKPLGSHTASDRTSKSAGDIEILKDKNMFEV